MRKTLIFMIAGLALIMTTAATAAGSKSKPPSAPGTSTGTTSTTSTTSTNPTSGEPAPGTPSNKPAVPHRTRMELFLLQPVSDGNWANFKLVITPGVGVHLSNVNVAFVYTNNYGSTDASKNNGWAKLRKVAVNGQSPLYNDGSSKNLYLVSSLREGHPVTITGQVQAPARKLVNGMLNRWFYMRAYAYTTSPATDSLNWSMWSNNAYQIYASS